MSARQGLTDTIVAIATARGRGAIGIVKISGENAWSMAECLFSAKKPKRKPNSKDGINFTSHRLNYGWIRHPETGESIDEVLLACMRRPHTYTGEDVVEINSHGGPLVLMAVLDAVVACGARLAEPGEFTRRAYLNGRIDLSQAEAVVDLIDAKSRKAIAIAGRRLDGELGRRVEEIRQKVLGIRARLEAQIDFADQVETKSNPQEIAQEIQNQIQPVLERWIVQYRQQRGYLEGVKVAVVGRPNVGKSSLINRLIAKERLLVNETPGTTRDLVDIPMTIGDTPVVLTDTAGLHASMDPVEAMGIEKTRNFLSECDLVIFLMDASEAFSPEDQEICNILKDRPVALVFNKMDLVATRVAPMLAESWPKWKSIGISVRYDNSTEEIENFLAELIKMDQNEMEDEIVPNMRQKRLMESSLMHLKAAARKLSREEDIEIAAFETAEALKNLDRIVGKCGEDEVLDEVFKRFCIGK